MKRVLTLILVALAAAPALVASPAYAQVKLTEADPPDGAALDVPPSNIRLCFSQPADFEEGSLFRFRHPFSDGRILVLPVELKPEANGECVRISPGYPQNPPAGDYVLEWQVAAAEGGEKGSGTLQYKASRGSAEGETPTPSDETPAPAGGGSGTGDIDDDGGPDTLLIVIVTIAVAGGAAVLTSLGYLLRRRIGFEPYRPPPDDEGGGGGH